MQIEIEGESIEIPHFAPRPLKNLLLVDELESLSPILDMRITDLAVRCVRVRVFMCVRACVCVCV